MHIVYVLPSLDIGGMEHFVVNLAEKMNKRGHRTTVLCTSHAGELARKAESLGIAVVVEPVRSSFENVFPLRIRNRMRALRPDVVHSQTGVWLPASIGARLAGISASCHTEHGLDVAETAKLRVVRAISLRLVRAIVAVSSPLRVELARQMIVDVSRIQRIDNGIDVEAIVAQPQERQKVREEFGVDDSTIVIGSVGRLNILKGFDILLEAMHLVSDGSMNILTVIVGDGEENQALRQLAASLQIPVKFMGFRSDVTRLMQGFDIFAMPSRSEGLPLALLEAMASGCAIIASRVGEIPTVLRQGRAGLLIDPGETLALAIELRSLIGDHAMRNRLRLEALRVVTEHYGVSAMVEKYEELYCSVMAR